MKSLSLRWRLMIAVGTVVVAAVAGVGLVAERATRVEFQKYLRIEAEGTAQPPTADELRDLAAPLGAVYGEGGWSLVSQRLAARLADDALHQAIVLGSDDELLATSHPELRELVFSSGADGELAIDRSGPEGTSESFRLRAPWAPVRGAAGETAGRLYLIPEPSGPEVDEAQPSDRFLGSVNRWILAAVLAAGLLALALTFATTRHVLAPVQELTAAAGELAAGRLGRRVTPRSDDEIGRLTRAFNSMAAAIEHNEELRRNMVSDTAHELRTPITNLRCQIEALEDGVIEPGPEVAASLAEEIQALSALVEDLQDLALAEAGRLTIDVRPLDLDVEVRQAVRAFAAGRARGRSIEVRLDELPNVAADPRRLRQILANLLDNAVGHTPEEGRIVLSARPAPDTPSAVEIAVADSGPGIAADDLANVFERYYRTDRSRQRRTGGAGLGLAIVRQLVEIQGGRVWAESPAEGGAVFRFTLRIA